MRPDVASFTFGVPSAGVRAAARGRRRGYRRTAAALPEAQTAVDRSVDAVAVQGPSAGGHGSTFDPSASAGHAAPRRAAQPGKAAVDVPVVAAGGLMTADDVGRVMAAGAAAAQLQRPSCCRLKRAAARAPRGAAGPARIRRNRCHAGVFRPLRTRLRNRFIDEHEAEAPLGYPE